MIQSGWIVKGGNWFSVSNQVHADFVSNNPNLFNLRFEEINGAVEKHGMDHVITLALKKSNSIRFSCGKGIFIELNRLGEREKELIYDKLGTFDADPNIKVIIFEQYYGESHETTVGLILENFDFGDGLHENKIVVLESDSIDLYKDSWISPNGEWKNITKTHTSYLINNFEWFKVTQLQVSRGYRRSTKYGFYINSEDSIDHEYFYQLVIPKGYIRFYNVGRKVSFECWKLTNKVKDIIYDWSMWVNPNKIYKVEIIERYSNYDISLDVEQIRDYDFNENE